MSVLKSYRVSVVRWDVHDIWVEAPNEDEAEDLARDHWFDGDRQDFKWRAGEIEKVEAEEETP